MSEKGNPGAEVDEDERRREAAERNRKATEAQWEANKRRWQTGNFPKQPEPSKPISGGS